MKEIQVPKRDDMVKCDECGKPGEKRDLFICCDPGHAQGSSSSEGSNEGEEDCVKIVLCALCIVGSHREHTTRTYIKQVSEEDRNMAVEKLGTIRESIDGKLKEVADSIVGELKLVSSAWKIKIHVPTHNAFQNIPVALLDSIEEVVRDEEQVRLWPKLEEQLAEAGGVEARVDKVGSSLLPTDLQTINTYVLRY